LFVGAGVTNTTMARFLKKHGFKNFVVFNRTYEKALTLSEEIRGIPIALADLKHYQNGFDVIITCTGADNHIITKEIYTSLLIGETDKKIVIDLAIPQDLDSDILENYSLLNFLDKLRNRNKYFYFFFHLKIYCNNSLKNLFLENNHHLIK
jgi:glutamyl-tRNA reductase